MIPFTAWVSCEVDADDYDAALDATPPDVYESAGGGISAAYGVKLSVTWPDAIDWENAEAEEVYDDES